MVGMASLDHHLTNIEECTLSKLNVLKLTTGEEIMGQVDKAQGYTVIKPVILVLNATPQGQTQVSIASYPSLSNSDRLVLSQEHVMFAYEPTENLANIYEQHISPLAAVKTPPLVV